MYKSRESTLVLIAFCLTAVVLVIIFDNVYSRLPAKNQKFVTFWVTPPAFGSKPDDPNRFYSVIAELLNGYQSQPFRAKPVVAMEVMATRSAGIVFLVSAPIELSAIIKNHLIAYWPKLVIKKVRDGNGVPEVKHARYKVREWRVSERELDHGTLEFLYAGMRNLKKDELVGWQMLVSAGDRSMVSRMINVAVKLPLISLKALVYILKYVIGGTVLVKRSPAGNALSAPTMANGAQLNVTLRTIVGSGSDERINRLNITIKAALQSSGLAQNVISGQYSTFDDFFRRSQNKTRPLPTSLLGRLYYFPAPSDILSEDMQLARSTTLSPPVSIKSGRKADVVLGFNKVNDVTETIGLSVSERQKHLLVIGGTGMGKSSLLAYSFVQDMLSGKGVALIDPHGDLARAMIRYVPQSRLKDIIYLDPSDVSYPVGLNLMELPSGLSPERADIAKDYITEAIVSIFRKIFSDDDSGGHRIEYILRSTIHTAFSVEHATLFTLHKLLTNDSYRAGVVSRIEDDSLRDFWYGEFNKAGSYQKVKMISGVTAKLGRFQRSLITRRMLEQPKTTVDFKESIDRGKIIVCNFAKGTIGEDTSALLGMVVLVKLQLAAWSRAEQPVGQRRPFYLYIDEFQDFAAGSLSQLASESRKFGISLILAEQTTAYQEEKDSNILLANIGNILCFRTAAPVDGRRLKTLFKPYLDEQDLSNLQPYNFYARLSTERTQEPISGTTALITAKGSALVAKKVISSSRKRYGSLFIAKLDTPVTEPIGRVPLKKDDLVNNT